MSARQRTALWLAALLTACSASASAQGLEGIAKRDDLVVPQYERRLLPPLGPAWQDSNPYRGHAAADAVTAVGRSIFNQTCARCHGPDADGSLAAPDLRLIGRACQRVPEPDLKRRCLADADHYFSQSVRYGKVRVGITHMPPWEPTLPQEAIWALRSFVESAPNGKAQTRLSQPQAPQPSP
jgi:mono/diheme cytochrome c family protein